MQYIFIVNQYAGEGGTEQKVREAISRLTQKNDCHIYITKSVGDATNYVKKVCKSEPLEEFRFIACGGDGTINEVFSGAMGHANASVTCYPCGSGNDFVKVFGAERFLDIEKLVTAPTKNIDVLKVGDRYSFNVVNFGFDTTVAIHINEERKKTGHGNKNGYKKGILSALITSMNNKLQVTADGTVINPAGQALLCTIANGTYVGGSFNCAPRAKVDDGLMEVCLLKPVSRFRFLRIIKPYSKGEHLTRKNMRDIVVYQQAKKVEVSAPEDFACCLDGEIIYKNHFTIEMLNGALPFACPE